MLLKTIAPQKHRFLNLLEMCFIIQQKRPYLLLLDQDLLDATKSDSSSSSWKHVRSCVVDPHKWMIFSICATLFEHLNLLLGNLRSNGGFVSFVLVDYLKQFQNKVANLTRSDYTYCHQLCEKEKTLLNKEGKKSPKHFPLFFSLFLCFFVSLFLCFFVSLFLCLFVCLFIYLFHSQKSIPKVRVDSTALTSPSTSASSPTVRKCVFVFPFQFHVLLVIYCLKKKRGGVVEVSFVSLWFCFSLLF